MKASLRIFSKRSLLERHDNKPAHKPNKPKQKTALELQHAFCNYRMWLSWSSVTMEIKEDLQTEMTKGWFLCRLLHRSVKMHGKCTASSSTPQNQGEIEHGGGCTKQTCSAGSHPCVRVLWAPILFLAAKAHSLLFKIPQTPRLLSTGSQMETWVSSNIHVP